MCGAVSSTLTWESASWTIIGLAQPWPLSLLPVCLLPLVEVSFPCVPYSRAKGSAGTIPERGRWLLGGVLLFSFYFLTCPQLPLQRNKWQQQELIAELRRRQAKDHRPVYEGKDGTIEDIITGKPYLCFLPWQCFCQQGLECDFVQEMWCLLNSQGKGLLLPLCELPVALWVLIF